MAVIPIDRQITELLEKRKWTRWTLAKVKRMTWLTKPATCQLCRKPIQKGEYYRDAGIHNRVHDTCVSARTD